jgi:hypothetical protein
MNKSRDDKRLKASCLLLAWLALLFHTSASGQETTLHDPGFRVKSKYDKPQDTTTTEVGPMILYGRLSNLPEYRLSASFTYPGKHYSTPAAIKLAFEIYINPKQNSYARQNSILLFIADGRRYSYGPLERRDYKEGKEIAIEWLSVEVTSRGYCQMMASLIKAKQVDLYIGETGIRLSMEQVGALEALARRIEN